MIRGCVPKKLMMYAAGFRSALAEAGSDEADFRPMKSAFAGGTARTDMKLVVDGLSEPVLGLHMLGVDAPEIVQSMAVALTCGATKRDFDRRLAVHPTAAEEFMLMRTPARRLQQARPA